MAAGMLFRILLLGWADIVVRYGAREIENLLGGLSRTSPPVCG
jgi:hypothetical protein